MTTGSNDGGSGPEDELFSRFFQQVTKHRAARYAATYDTDAGLARFRKWLQEHTAPPIAGQAERIGAGSIVTAIRAAGDAIEIPVRPLPAKLEQTAEQAVTEIYTTYYRPLVRLAVLLVRDEPTAEEIVQECFIAMHDGWQRLREEDKALSYLKQAVVNRSKSVLRHRSVADRNAPKPAPDMPSAEQGPMPLLERSAVITALRGLPDRQRQALVLRYYADMSEAQIAEMMGISRGAVKSHTARGMSSLRAVLEETC